VAGHLFDMTDDNARILSPRGAWWRRKVVAGAMVMCVAAVAAQFSTKDFRDNPTTAQAAALTAPICGVVAIVLLTSPPAGRRSVLGVVAPLAALVVLAGFVFPVDHRRERLEAVVRTVMFVCTPLAGAATYLHLARLVADRRHRVAAAAFVLLAAMLVAGAVLYAMRYGHTRGVVHNGWYYTVPGPGERVAPFGFALDWLIRPGVELENFLESPQWAAYLIITVMTPLLCVALMIWLATWCASGSPDSRSPQR
jgi:hypothetical protein